MMRRLGVLVFVALALLIAGCGVPRVNVITGTTIGLKATPGDGQTRPPQVTLGYKRGELALVPTSGVGATQQTDAQSAVAAFHFSTRWFGSTELDSFIATGGAARSLGASTAYIDEVAKVTLVAVPEAIQERRLKLAAEARTMTEEQADKVLQNGQLPRKANKTARGSLNDYILDATTDPLLTRLESAFAQSR